MLPPWGLMLTRPGETAMSAGAMFKPCGETLTPVGDTEMRVCTHRHHLMRPAPPTRPSQQQSNSTGWAAACLRFCMQPSRGL